MTLKAGDKFIVLDNKVNAKFNGSPIKPGAVLTAHRLTSADVFFKYSSDAKVEETNYLPLVDIRPFDDIKAGDKVKVLRNPNNNYLKGSQPIKPGDIIHVVRLQGVEVIYSIDPGVEGKMAIVDVERHIEPAWMPGAGETIRLKSIKDNPYRRLKIGDTARVRSIDGQRVHLYTESSNSDETMVVAIADVEAVIAPAVVEKAKEPPEEPAPELVRRPAVGRFARVLQNKVSAHLSLGVALKPGDIILVERIDSAASPKAYYRLPSGEENYVPVADLTLAESNVSFADITAMRSMSAKLDTISNNLTDLFTSVNKNGCETRNSLLTQFGSVADQIRMNMSLTADDIKKSANTVVCARSEELREKIAGHDRVAAQWSATLRDELKGYFSMLNEKQKSTDNKIAAAQDEVSDANHNSSRLLHWASSIDRKLEAPSFWTRIKTYTIPAIITATILGVMGYLFHDKELPNKALQHVPTEFTVSVP